jgi:hypothetical protein
VQVLEITQSTIQRTVWNLARDEDWGTPLDYDIIVSSSAPGSKETEYTVLPRPKRERGVMIDDAWEQAKLTGFDIERLWSGGDPFAETGQPFDERAAKAQDDDDSTIPF